MARYLAGEMTSKEEITYLRELEHSRGLLSELENMEKNWKYFDRNPPGKSWDSEKGWLKLHQKLETDGLLEDHGERANRSRFTPLLRVAASIALVLAIGIPALYFGVIQNDGEQTLRTHLALEGVSTIDLPDGSRIYLNKGAEISYSTAFQNQRAIELKGEAFFEVMSDPRNPFTVHSGEMLITVLGTSFNVKQQDNSSEIYVKTGKVRVSLDNSDQFIQLEPEEVGICEDRELNSHTQEDPNYISWKTKDFKFVNSALTEVLEELEESYHVDILSEGLDLKDLRITTSYSGQSIDNILETIGAAFEMNVSRTGNSYYLTK
jgi:ferric-dicitrate binding protein FerR (iron transport regulator)